LGECNNSSDIIKILVAANELKLQGLVNHLQTSLVENNSNWMEQNFNIVYQTSFENDSFSELQKYCNDLISKEPDKLFNSLGFTSIPENVLIPLIQNDNLRMRETQIWEHVLKWGFAQNSELPSDITKFSKNDFNILKSTLQQCIPFIRFYNFNSKEFSDKVLPYKKILPKELYMDLLKTFLNTNPDSRPSDKLKPRNNIGSEIITNRHVELILGWVDKLDITDKLASSYEFKLLLHGSRDGFSNCKFHEICKDQPRVIIVVKVKGSNKILGGYNPIGWNYTNGGYSKTNDSFIFSFENSESADNYILSRVVDENHAIWNGHYYGPSFGNYDFILEGSNFYDRSYCSKGVYENLIRKTGERFSVEDYEIFQITKING
jgi:hypothetical protein